MVSDWGMGTGCIQTQKGGTLVTTKVHDGRHFPRLPQCANLLARGIQALIFRTGLLDFFLPSTSLGHELWK